MKREEIIEEVFSSIDKASNLFYQRKNKDGYDAVNACIPQIIAFIQMVQQEGKVEQIETIIPYINEGLSCTLQAIQSKDTVLIADQLVHVVKPLLKQMIA